MDMMEVSPLVGFKVPLKAINCYKLQGGVFFSIECHDDIFFAVDVK